MVRDEKKSTDNLYFHDCFAPLAVSILVSYMINSLQCYFTPIT